MRTNIKHWTVGSPTQAPLDAVDLMRRKHAFTAEDVRSAEVRLATQQARVVDNRDMPDVCVQHMMAVMLIDGTASFEAAHDVPRMQDPAVLRQRAKARLMPNAELEALLPKRGAVVEITLNDGIVLRRGSGRCGAPRQPNDTRGGCREVPRPDSPGARGGKGRPPDRNGDDDRETC